MNALRVRRFFQDSKSSAVSVFRSFRKLAQAPLLAGFIALGCGGNGQTHSKDAGIDSQVEMDIHAPPIPCDITSTTFNFCTSNDPSRIPSTNICSFTFFTAFGIDYGLCRSHPEEDMHPNPNAPYIGSIIAYYGADDRTPNRFCMDCLRNGETRLFVFEERTYSLSVQTLNYDWENRSASCTDINISVAPSPGAENSPRCL